jgi:acyl transferase domain-containing protein/acyl carrier protein
MTPNEPLAIVGIGCRVPGGATTPELFWRMLCDGVDGVSDVPPSRWLWESVYHPQPGTPGKLYVRRGGFIGDIDKFDAQFFNISPREAAWADPQQRLLLEVAYESLEDAGIPLHAIEGTRTGVFIGISTYDYGTMNNRTQERTAIDAYSTLGSALCVAANRLSYFFNLHGPSMAVDTACSSSLVAAHLACRSIWNGDATMALVGGVNVTIQPEGTIGFCQSRMLAPDGRCKSFDASADGYARAEGVGVIVVKPLSAAIADADSIYSVIRATYVNQDGRTAGITVPSDGAQEAMLREVYRQAGLTADSVHYIEAHGTGTSVGDPLELSAIGRVLGAPRTDGSCCLVGSVKSNVGHLEAASGVAGLIKASLALRHARIPPSLHFTTPNPQIPFDELNLRVVQELEPWPANGRGPRVAGVNSFGFGGTNAHVVLASAPDPVARRVETPWQEGRALLIPLSARSPAAIRAVARDYTEHLGDEQAAGLTLADIAYTTAQRRTHHPIRAAFAVHSVAELIAQLSAFGEDETAGEEAAIETPRSLVFVFSGMGPQWWAMGRHLQREEPVFREALEACDRALRAHVPWSLLDELGRDEAQTRVNETYVAQPAIFAIQTALCRLWESWGIRADAVLGHSLGEVAAAHYAGVLTLKDAVALIYHRSRLQQLTAGEGRMLAVSMPVADIEPIVAEFGGAISIAAYNSPESVTLSGDTDALQKAADRLTARDIFNRFLKVEVPYHSRAMDRLRDELLRSLASLSPRPARIKLVSTLTGKPVSGEEMTADYWWRSMRQPVRFREAVETVLADGHHTLVEISPHPVLSASVSECASPMGREVTVLPSLRRNEPERATALTSVGRLYAMGRAVEWKRINGDDGRFVSLPRYPWQRDRYWHEAKRARLERIGERVHPLLGVQSETVRPAWVSDFNHYPLSYLDDHRVDRHVIFPAAGYVEMAIAAAHELNGKRPCVIDDIAIHKAMLLPPDARPTVQLATGERASEFEIFSRTRGADSPWERHVTGKFFALEGAAPPRAYPIEQIKARCPFEVPHAETYRQFAARGLHYGPAFMGIKHLWVGEDEAIARIEVDEDLIPDITKYHAHPGVSDSAFQVVMGALWRDAMLGRLFEGLFLPVRIAKVVSRAPLPRAFWAYARVVRKSARRMTGDIFMLDDRGAPLLETHALVGQHVERRDGAGAVGLYKFNWEPEPPERRHVVRNSDFLPSPLRLIDQMRADYGDISWRNDRNAAARAPETMELARGYVFEALAQLGYRGTVGERFHEAALAERLGVVDEHRRFFARILTSLGADGFLTADGDQWIVARPLARRGMRELGRAIWDRFPSVLAELTLVRRCGENLAGVLQGRVDPLDLMFPGGSSNIAEHLYQDAPVCRNCNRIVQKAVATALRRMPEGRKARILDIGGGTGGMAAYVLPELSARRAEYVFTDIAPLLLSQAEQRFGRHSFVEFKSLDIEKNPVDQDFVAHSFDLVLASDVLHATADLRRTLEHCKQLLASEGLLILLEGTWAPTPLWCTLVFGMLKGWWLFTDAELRGEDPWISATAWCDLLNACGFTGATGLTEELGADEAVHSVIAARGPVVLEDAPTVKADKTAEQPGAWMILSDGTGVGSDLTHRLEAAGHHVTCITAAQSVPEARDRNGRTIPVDMTLKDAMRTVVAEALDGPIKLDGIVHLWSLDLPPIEALDRAAIERTRTDLCTSVLHLVQTLVEADPLKPPRLFIATRRLAQVTADESDAAIGQAPVWGMGRVIMTECPQLRCRLIDLEAGADAAAGLYAELGRGDNEEEVALRDGTRFVRRFARTTPAQCNAWDGRPQPPAEAAGSGHAANRRRPFKIDPPMGGSIDNLAIHPAERAAPGPGQIEIEILAAGLNFKDVMLAMGLLPDDALEGAYTGRVMGMECAGRISAVGEGVTDWEVGDPVVACGPGTLRAYLTLDARIVTRLPDHLSFEEGATLTGAFQTAYYSLHMLARLQRGERVLIHAATGGVGLAAIQVAQYLGASIFATAGTDEKRELLRALGVPHVMNSRTLSFADEIMDITEGEGVDVVLNSLAGDAIPKSLSVLRPYGRFVEIGKRDVYEDSKVGLRPFRQNLSMFVVDMDRLCAERPEATRRAFDEVMRLVDNGAFRPLPHRVFPVDRTQEALRYMAQAKHIGKVVVSMQDPPVAIAPPPRPQITFRDDATYLITGGLGGFGLALARWLVQSGARHLALMSRRAEAPPEAKAAIDAMRADGANVMLMQGDVANENELGRVLTTIRESMPPLRGIFHAAMVIDDTLIEALTAERFNRVVSPKADGAWNLHRQTLDTRLDHFVLFSSMAAIVGNPSQANYAAANTFLDSLARYRRDHGLPALTVNWGALADVGYVSQNPEIAQRLEANGLKPVPSDQMLATLGVLLANDADQVSAVQVDWPKLTRKINLSASPRFADLVAEQGGDEPGAEGLFDLDSVVRADPGQRLGILESRLREHLAKVLGTTAGRLDIHQSLMNLGMDSLMAVEMRNRIRAELGVDIPPVKFMEGLSLRGMALFVLERLGELHGFSPAVGPIVTAPAAAIRSGRPGAQATDQNTADVVGELTDDEVNAELRRMLAETGKS